MEFSLLRGDQGPKRMEFGTTTDMDISLTPRSSKSVIQFVSLEIKLEFKMTTHGCIKTKVYSISSC